MVQEHIPPSVSCFHAMRFTTRRHIDLARVHSAICPA